MPGHGATRIKKKKKKSAPVVNNHHQIPIPESTPQSRLKKSIRQYLYSIHVQRSGMYISDVLEYLANDAKLRKHLDACLPNAHTGALKTFLDEYPETFHTRAGMVYVQQAKKMAQRCENMDGLNQNWYESNAIRLDIPDMCSEPVRFVKLASEVKRLATRLLSMAKRCESPVVIGVDMEMGINPRGNGSRLYISLLQLSTMDNEIYIIDVQACRCNVFDKQYRLKELLESDKVVKVIHDCRVDVRKLYDVNVDVSNIFDTSVAYHLICSHNSIYKRDIGLKDLVCEYGWKEAPPRLLTMKSAMKAEYKKSRNLWGKRPVPVQQLAYAAFDVRALVPELYENLLYELKYFDIMQQFQNQCDSRLLRAAARREGLDTSSPPSEMLAECSLEDERNGNAPEDSTTSQYAIHMPFAANRRKRYRRQQEIDEFYSRRRTQETTAPDAGQPAGHPVLPSLPLPKEPTYDNHQPTESWDDEIGPGPYRVVGMAPTWTYRAPPSAFR